MRGLASAIFPLNITMGSWYSSYGSIGLFVAILLAGLWSMMRMNMIRREMQRERERLERRNHRQHRHHHHHRNHRQRNRGEEGYDRNDQNAATAQSIQSTQATPLLNILDNQGNQASNTASTSYQSNSSYSTTSSSPSGSDERLLSPVFSRSPVLPPGSRTLAPPPSSRSSSRHRAQNTNPHTALSNTELALLHYNRRNNANNNNQESDNDHRRGERRHHRHLNQPNPLNTASVDTVSRSRDVVAEGASTATTSTSLLPPYIEIDMNAVSSPVIQSNDNFPPPAYEQGP